MASSSFTDAPAPDRTSPDNKSVTIVINDNGEINYDEKTLQSIIGQIFVFNKEQPLSSVAKFMSFQICFPYGQAICHPTTFCVMKRELHTLHTNFSSFLSLNQQVSCSVYIILVGI